MLDRDEVLEVDFGETEPGWRHLSRAVANLQNVDLGALAAIVSPKADGNLFAGALQDEEEAGHFKFNAHLGDDKVVKVSADQLQGHKFFQLEELADRAHAPVRIVHLLVFIAKRPLKRSRLHDRELLF